MKCTFCKKRIRNARNATKGIINGKITYFCSEACAKLAEKIAEYVPKVERELGYEWIRVYLALVAIHIEKRVPKCENCLDYILGICEGGVEPFECFFRKLKKAKEAGMGLHDIILIKHEGGDMA